MSLLRAEHNLYRYEPTEEDVNKALEEISVHEAAIAALDSRLCGLLQEVRRIEETKRTHAAAIVKCKGVLTLARRIPGEILARIFEHCVLEGWTRGPIVVSQVCSAWRDAAKTPSVWSHVYIDCDKGDPVARCKLWLQNAQRTALHVTLRTSEHLPLLETVLGLLVDRMETWASFSLEAPTANSANYVLAQCVKACPLLGEVTVRLGESSVTVPRPDVSQGQDRLLECRRAFENARNLRRMNLVTDISQSWMGLPQLVTLHLQLNYCQFQSARKIFASEVLEALSDSPNLRELTITIHRLDKRDFELQDPAHIVTLSELTSLTLSMPIPLMSFIQHLRAPNLTHLFLRSPDDPFGFACEQTRTALRDFVEYSAPPLRVLQLYDIDVSQDDFLFLFEQLPALEDLRLHGSEILDETIGMLCPPTGLLPRLKRLDLRWCGHISGLALEGLVRSRQLGSMQVAESLPLEELAVINCSFVNEESVVGILDFCKCRLKMLDVHDYCCKYAFFYLILKIIKRGYFRQQGLL